MTFPYRLSLKKDIVLKEHDEDLLVVNPTAVPAAIRVKRPSPGIRAMLDALTNGKHSEDELYDLIFQNDGPDQAARFWYYLNKFDRQAMLCRGIFPDGQHLATLIPASPDFKFTPAAPDRDQPLILSRFVVCRRNSRGMVLESPLGYGKMELGSSGARVAADLFRPVTLSGICRRYPEGTEDEIRAFVTLLMNIKAVEDPAAPEKDALQQWECHDLLFHTRCRSGRSDSPLGGTFRFRDRIDPRPAVKPQMAGESISLFTPDIETLKGTDIPFTRVLEDRRSIRDYSHDPMSAGQLGEFLFRAARVKVLNPAAPDHGALYASTIRPAPSGGATHSIEIYPVINECDGIDPGLYHYEPRDHTLTRLSGMTGPADKLLDGACMASGLQYEPGILLVLAARFQRLAWKYESIAYSLLLKDVGALYQTFYLVATAMGLAPCALGAGDSDLFARAAGLDYYTETSVGEFLLARPKE